MSESYTSPAVTVIDIPEAELVTIKFYYNFFQQDEMVNGTSSEELRYTASIDTERLDAMRVPAADYMEAPRYVEIIWDPVTPTYSAHEVDTYAAILAEYTDRIQSELDVGTSRYATVTLQDENIEDSIAEELAIASRVRHLNTGSSALQTAMMLMSNTSTNINVEGLLDAGNLYDDTGYSFIDVKTGETIAAQTSDASRHSVSLSLDEKIIGDITARAADMTFGAFYAGASFSADDAAAIQEDARSDGADLSTSDYEPMIITLDIEVAEPPSASESGFSASTVIVGYIIEKTETTVDGEVEAHTPIIVAGYDSSNYIDYDIKYGSSYNYKIKTVAMMWLDTDADGEKDAVALISGRRGSARTVVCKETVPPQPPRDLSFFWDYDNDNLYLFWEPPYSPQRDIKRYQIFRRSSLEEPFELQAQLDFDDSEVLHSRSENIPDSLNRLHDFPISQWSDNEFEKVSDYIYAIVAVDAHDLSSGYSVQYRVTFDSHKNRLVPKMISSAGAPKPYPNLNIVEDFFTQDAIKTSGYEKVRIYFDPEYLIIHDGTETMVDLEHLKGWDDSGSLNGQYDLQFINLDLQQSKTVKIKPYMNNFSFSYSDMSITEEGGTDWNPLTLLQEYLAHEMDWSFTL